MEKNKKNYVLDTNILLQQPNSIFGFDDNNVIITGTTTQELDKKKTCAGELGFNAREAIRIIDSLKNKGDYLSGITLPSGGLFVIEPNGVVENNLPKGFDISIPDNRIISATITLSKKDPKTKTILITNDISMRINASICGVETQGYHNEEIRHIEDAYTGRCDLYIPSAEYDTFMKTGEIKYNEKLMEIYVGEKKYEEMIENEFCVLRSFDAPDEKTALGMYRHGEITRIDDKKGLPFGIIGKNSGQKFALKALMAPASEIPLVILKGPAGCAKTFLSIAAGLDASYHQGYYKGDNSYDKVMITRSNTLSDADLGFLPGTLEEKMGPLVAPFMDNLESLLKMDSDESMENIKMQIQDLFDDGIVEICSIAYMRGRSITDAFLIVDEAQNVSVNQILEIISRAGNNCKIVIAGDPDQIDNPKLDKINNGLVFAAEKMKGSDLCAQITFTQEETVRSPLATEAAKRLTN